MLSALNITKSFTTDSTANVLKVNVSFTHTKENVMTQNQLFSAAKMKDRPDHKAKFHAIVNGKTVCGCEGTLHFHRTGILKKRDAIVALLNAEGKKACGNCMKRM